MDKKEDKSTINEPGITTPTRHSQFDPDALIPQTLRSGSVEGFDSSTELRMHSKTLENGSMIFVATDNRTLPISSLQDHFLYFDAESLAKFPEIIQNENCYRPLFHGTLTPLGKDVMFFDMFEIHEALRGKGIGASIQENVYKQAEASGYKFVCAYHNDSDVASFFLKRGAFLLDEVKDEYQALFADVYRQELNPADVFFTVKFLHQEDVDTYIKPERRTMTIKDRLRWKENRIALNSTLDAIENMLTAANKSTDGSQITDRLISLTGILDELSLLSEREEVRENGIGNLTPTEIGSLGKTLIPRLQLLITQLRTIEDVGEDIYKIEGWKDIHDTDEA